MRLSARAIAAAILYLGSGSGCSHTVLASSAASAPGTSRTEIGDGLSVRDLGGGAYVVTHALPWPANSLVVRMPDGTIVLAGSPYTPEATRTVLTWVRAHLGSGSVVAINNGYHVDNLGGNAALFEAGIPVHGSDLTVRLLSQRGEATRQLMLRMIGDPSSPAHKAHASVPYLPPDHVFVASRGLTLTFGSEQVRVIYPGPSQAPDKVAIFFPSRHLLYGGCMILSGDRAGNLADADLDAWPKVVASLASLSPSIVVPGHGDRLDAGLIQNTLDVLAHTARPAPPK